MGILICSLSSVNNQINTKNFIIFLKFTTNLFKFLITINLFHFFYVNLCLLIWGKRKYLKSTKIFFCHCFFFLHFLQLLHIHVLFVYLTNTALRSHWTWFFFIAKMCASGLNFSIFIFWHWNMTWVSTKLTRLLCAAIRKSTKCNKLVAKIIIDHKVEDYSIVSALTSASFELKAWCLEWQFWVNGVNWRRQTLKRIKYS